MTSDGLKELQNTLSWALDLLDLYDKHLIALGGSEETVYSPIHLEGKKKARIVLAKQEAPASQLSQQDYDNLVRDAILWRKQQMTVGDGWVSIKRAWYDKLLQANATASQPRLSEPFAYACPAGCGCIWRDNKDGTMSLFGKNSKSCEVCEPLPLSKLIPLNTAITSAVPQADINESPTEWGRVLDPPIAMKQEEIGPFLEGIANPPAPDFPMSGVDPEDYKAAPEPSSAEREGRDECV